MMPVERRSTDQNKEDELCNNQGDAISKKNFTRDFNSFHGIPIEITAMMETAGITILLKMALPAVVPIPPEKPEASFSTKRKKKEVNTSGIELAMAFIVAPLTPSERLRPTYSEATIKPSPARQITRQHNAISYKWNQQAHWVYLLSLVSTLIVVKF